MIEVQGVAMITDDQKWMPIGQAAVMLGVSERTVRNYINSGKVPIHKDRGRTFVDVSPILAERPGEFTNPTGRPEGDFETVGEGNPGTLLKIIGAELALRGQAQDMIARVERETEALRADCQSARRSGRRGWVLAGLLLIGLGAGGAWSAWELQRREGQADTAKAQVVLQADLVRAAQDQYEGALAQYEKAVKEHDEQVAQLREQLNNARATLDEHVLGEIERAGADAARREEAARVELSALAQIEILDRKLEDAKAELTERGEAARKLEESLESERMKVAFQSEKRVADAEAAAQAEAKIESLERLLSDYKERVVRLEELFRVGEKVGEEEASPPEPASEAAVNPLEEPLNAAPEVGEGTLDKKDEGSVSSVDATAKVTPE
jgi:hypothetical protein